MHKKIVKFIVDLFFTCVVLGQVVDEGERDRLYSLVEVECRGHEPAVLRSYLTFLSTAAAHLGIEVTDVLVSFPTLSSVFTLSFLLFLFYFSSSDDLFLV